MLHSSSFPWSESWAYIHTPTNLCTIVVSTNPTHVKHPSITDLCAIAMPPILHCSCSCSLHKKRRRPSNEFDVSHPRPVPSVVHYWLRNHWKRRQVSVTIIVRIYQQHHTPQKENGNTWGSQSTLCCRIEKVQHTFCSLTHVAYM